jgi:hypothetical protein
MGEKIKIKEKENEKFSLKFYLKLISLTNFLL